MDAGELNVIEGFGRILQQECMATAIKSVTNTAKLQRFVEDLRVVIQGMYRTMEECVQNRKSSLDVFELLDNTLKEKLDGGCDHEKEIMKLKAKIERLEGDKEALKKQCEDLVKEKDREEENTKNEIIEVNKQLCAQVEQLKNELENVKQAARQFRNQMYTYADETEAERDMAQKRVDVLEVENKRLKAETERLTYQIGLSKMQLNEKGKELEEQRELMIKLEKQMEEMKKEISNTSRERMEAMTQMAAQNERNKSEMERLSAENEEQKRVIESQHATILADQMEKQGIMAELQESKKKLHAREVVMDEKMLPYDPETLVRRLEAEQRFILWANNREHDLAIAAESLQKEGAEARNAYIAVELKRHIAVVEIKRSLDQSEAEVRELRKKMQESESYNSATERLIEILGSRSAPVVMEDVDIQQLKRQIEKLKDELTEAQLENTKQRAKFESGLISIRSERATIEKLIRECFDRIVELRQSGRTSTCHPLVEFFTEMEKVFHK